MVKTTILFSQVSVSQWLLQWGHRAQEQDKVRLIILFISSFTYFFT